ncbi:fumarylacetoacetase [Massilia timonae]|uniref:fumarylacetoacetase n=1 Tax=Massilia timonae TaxID=47229 RepID=UPI0028D6CCF1|nr:fumarylacetoacetase [Massilia timonae]
MTTALERSRDPGLRSWVASANDPATDFPIQNLPFGRFRPRRGADWRIGVAIGDQILDLSRAGLIDHGDMNRLMAQGRPTREALRVAISQGLEEGSAQRGPWLDCDALLPLAQAELGVPCRIGDYTDFYTGIHHATTVGKLFRPDSPLVPNYKWVPIGYHGRASSIGASGQRFHRPQGQTLAPDGAQPALGPSRRLDFELELGAYIGMPNEDGTPIRLEVAEDHLFGFSLLNDWSARDIQAWEYQPLGPFLSKNFATTVSPWIVTPEALAPFRAPSERPAQDPAPLPYLDSGANRAAGAFDITLEVWLRTASMARAGLPAERLMRSNYRDAYWTVAQMIAHHTVNGCNLGAGDLLGTGTLSGPAPEQGGSLLELSQGGTRAFALSNGEARTWLEDGDTVILRGSCERPGVRRIGFGDCSGTVLPARA